MNNIQTFENHIEKLILSLDQIEALLTVGLHVDISALAPKIHFNYWYIANNLVNHAQEICEKLTKDHVLN